MSTLHTSMHSPTSLLVAHHNDSSRGENDMTNAILPHRDDIGPTMPTRPPPRIGTHDVLPNPHLPRKNNTRHTDPAKHSELCPLGKLILDSIIISCPAVQLNVDVSKPHMP
jgi:hypothetical protein